MIAHLQFNCHSSAGKRSVDIAVHTLVIAGWAGRDEKALHHHIEELAAIGVLRPSSVPVFYRGSASLLTQANQLDVLGPDSSGEVEPVIVALDDGLWLGVGSDHTDRKAETFGIALSKQMCGKPLSRDLWRLDDVIDRWDSLVMQSHATINGESVLYQHGLLANLRPPADLINKWANGGSLTPGTVMFGGTLGALGGISPAEHFAMAITDPVAGRSLSHAYQINTLPIIS
jgi:Protein of unknown function (DUF2848)